VPPAAPGWVTLGELLVQPLPYFDRAQHQRQPVALYSMAAFGCGRPDFLDSASLHGKLAMVRSGDVLLSRASAEPRRAWVVADDAGRTPLASGEWLVARSRAHDPGYLRHLLVSNEFQLRFLQAVAGARQANAAAARLRAIELPAPAQPQQQALARLLDLADALRAKRRRALSALDALQSAWQDPALTELRSAAGGLEAAMIASRNRLDALLGALRDSAFRGELNAGGGKSA
jgi:type I restriction enzyme S subunit